MGGSSSFTARESFKDFCEGGDHIMESNMSRERVTEEDLQI